MEAIATSLVEICGLNRDAVAQANTCYHISKLSRLAGQVRYMLLHGGPMLPQVQNDWAIQLDMMHHDNEHDALILFQNALVIASKLYQHPEIAISLHHVNEDTIDDDGTGNAEVQG